MVKHITNKTVINTTYGNIFTNTYFFNVYSETGYSILCVIVLFNIIKGGLLMTMGNLFVMHLRENSCLTKEFRKSVHTLVL